MSDDEGEYNGLPKPSKPDDDLVSYVRQLEIPLAEAAESASSGSERVVVVATYREINKREASLASHKKCSVVIESLLRASSAEQLVAFTNAVAPYLPWMCTNRYSSHVLETLFSLLARVLYYGEHAAASGSSDADDSAERTVFSPEQLVDALVSMVAELSTHAAVLLPDTSGTHVYRALLRVLGGPSFLVGPSAPSALGASESVTALSASAAAAASVATTLVPTLLPKESTRKLRHALADLSASLLLVNSEADAEGGAGAASDLRLYDFCCNPSASATLQLLLEVSAGATKAASLKRTVCYHLLNWHLPSPAADTNAERKSKKRSRAEASGASATGCDAAQPAAVQPASLDAARAWVSDLMCDPVGSRVVEAVLVHGDEDLFASLLTNMFAGNLARAAKHLQANYVVQRLLLCAFTDEQRSMIVRELLPHVPVLVASGREGVLWHMVASVAGSAAYVVPSADPVSSSPASSSLSSSGSVGSSSSSGAVGRTKKGGSAEKNAKPSGIVPAFTPLRCTTPANDDLQSAVITALCLTADGAAAASSSSSSFSSTASSSSSTTLTDTALSTKHHVMSNGVVRWWLDLDGARSGRAAASAAAAGASTSVDHIVTSPMGTRVLAGVLRLRPAISGPLIVALSALPQRELLGLCSDPFVSRHIIEYVAGCQVPALARECAR